MPCELAYLDTEATIELSAKAEQLTRSYPVMKFTRLFFLLLIAGPGGVVAQDRSAGALLPELVVPVDPTEARQVIESDPAAELRFEELSWLSNGRIRVAKIDGDVLALVGERVQFTAFDDAEPIIVISQGVDGHEWRASRINGRVEPDAYGGLEAAAQANPEVNPSMIEQALGELHTRQNEVSWRVGTSLQDPISGDYLLRAEDLDTFVINPRTGEYQTIKDLESSTRGLAEKDGIVAPCAPEVKAMQQRREQAARSGLPAPTPPPLPGAVPGSVPSATKAGRAPDGAVFSRAEPPGCADLGDAFEVAKNLSAESSRQWPYHEFQRGKPVPANAVTNYSVSGSISSDGAGPLTKQKAPNARHYSIRSMPNNPAYVVIFEASRRWPAVIVDDNRSQAEIDAWQSSPEMVAYRKTEDYRASKENADSLAAHMAAARARIAARPLPTGGVR